jgi:arylsulfatase
MSLKLSTSHMGLLLAVALSHGPAVAADASQAGDGRRPNILLILADDLGYSDISPYGGEIETPNLEKLAREGTRLTNFHVAPTCSPTRSSLLSGTDHHLAGIGTMAELILPNQKGKPGYEGYLNDNSLSFPALLRDAGYHTYMSGKWHLGLDETHRPTARGFEESFALLQGGGFHFDAPQQAATSYTENDKPVKVPPDYYSSNYFTDKLISFLDKNRGDSKPFFAYAAFTAPHWPLQAPPELIAKYKGRYDAGYQAIRSERLDRLSKLGIIDPSKTVHKPLAETSDLPAWDKLTPEQKKLEARRMETYAAMVDNLDQNIGRLFAYLKKVGQYDNTAIFFLSDNGAEGHVIPQFRPPHMNNSLENIGKADSYVYYGARWAEVGATPFRLSKGFTAEGGVISPAIVRYSGLDGKGTNKAEIATVRDLAPTFLELAGVPNPGAYYQGKNVNPITGESLLPYLRHAVAAPHPKDFVQGEELFGNRSIRQGDWKIVWIVAPVGSNRWELFDLARDPGETTDLAATNPQKLAELKALWDNYVRDNKVVLPEGDIHYLSRALSIGD